jgi:hypothetical protein
VEVARKQRGDDRGLSEIDGDTTGVSGTVRMEPVAGGRTSPGQQEAGLQLHEAAATHPLGDQRPLVLGHGTTDLEHELIVGVVAHRPVEEVHLAANVGKLLQQHHLMHGVAGQAVRCGDDDAVQFTAVDGIAQAVQPGSHQTGTAVAVIAEDMIVGQRPVLGANVGTQAVELLLNRLVLNLVAGGDADRDRDAHGTPPAGATAPWLVRPTAPTDTPSSTAGGADRPDPSGAGHRPTDAWIGAPATGVSCPPPR